MLKLHNLAKRYRWPLNKTVVIVWPFNFEPNYVYLDIVVEGSPHAFMEIL